MRKLKPRKEKKKIDKSISPLSIVEEYRLEMAMHLTNLAESTKRHIAVWKKELDERDGVITIEMMVLLECIAAGAVTVRDKYYEDVSIAPNLSRNPIIARCMALCYSCFGSELVLTEDDIKQRLPSGFMGTLGAMARVTKALIDKKLEKFQEETGVLKELGALAGLVESYLSWVHEEITFNEILPSAATDVMLKREEARLTLLYNRGVLNGDFVDLQQLEENKEKEEIKQELTKEEIYMKTDKEMIKEMLEEEKAKVEKKRGRTKKVKSEEVEEVVAETVGENPVNPGHYNILGFNTIELIAGHLGKKGAFYFYLGNAFKYLLRAENKNGKEDYLKARQYLEWIVENKEVADVTSVDEVLKGLETNWLNVSIAILSEMKGAKALLLNSVFENFFNGRYAMALDQLNILLDGE